MSTLLISQLIKLGFVITIILYLCSKTVESKCKNDCNLGLASYYVQPGETLDVISGYFNNVNITDIVNYNRDQVPTKDSLESGTRINVPFPCGCVNDTFLGHVFSYVFQKGDTYESVAQFNYTNLTTFGWIQEVNSFPPDDVPDNAIINVPVNCSCGNSTVSMDYGLFITYPLRVQDSLSSISKQFGLNESLLQEYNPGANFSAGDGIVYIPGKDESGIYPPLVLRSTSGSGLAGGVIIGICIAAVVIIIILSIWVYLRCIKRKKMNTASLLPEKSENQLSGSIGQAGGSTNIPGVDIDKSVEFSYEELAKATDNFNFSFKIGEGGYGTVYFAELRGEVLFLTSVIQDGIFTLSMY